MSRKLKILTSTLNSFAVYWPPLPEDQYGQPRYDTPVEVACRWEDRQDQYVDARGQVQVSNAVVKVQTTLATKGVLWHGRLADITGSGPFDNVNAFAIDGIASVPTFNGTQADITIFLRGKGTSNG